LEEFNITKEQYKELTDYILALKLRIQDLEDIVINDISAINISDGAIAGRHIGSTEINISKLDIDLDDISDGDTYGKVYASALEEGLALLSEAAGDLDDIQDGVYGKVLLTSITAGKIILAQCDGSLDNIANGEGYGKVNLTAITAGNILLSTCSGSMDDISDGDTYGKVLGTSLSESAILLSAALGNLDNIDDGASYGKVAVTDISSGHIKLSECEGGLDNISDGATYGKVAITDISSGHIDLAFCVGDLDDIANGTSYAKVALTSISAGKIIVAGLDSGVTAKMFTDGTTKTNIEAWKHATDVTKIDGGDIYTDSVTVRKIVLDSSGYLYTAGKTSYTDSTAGIWMGYSSGYKLNIGTGSATAKSGNCLLWDGSGLTVRGSIKVGGGSNEDITFEDSGIRMYDFLNGYSSNYDGLTFKTTGRNILNFYDISHGSTQTIARIFGGSGDYLMTSASSALHSSSFGALHSSHQVSLTLKPDGGDYSFVMYGTGTLQFPALGATAPTAHEADFCIETGSGDSANKCHFYDGDSQWNYLQDYDSW